MEVTHFFETLWQLSIAMAPYILFVSTIEPRKNVSLLLKAFRQLLDDYHVDVKLVMAGEKGWLYKDVFKAARQSPFASEIIFTGFVNNNDKPYLYSLASLFVYPSFYEGFGFPPLEAMACKTPLITSKFSSLPETVGKAAIIIDPYDIDEFACAMNLALKDKNS